MKQSLLYWNGVEWNEVDEWSGAGVPWREVKWNEVGWSGVEWTGVERSEVE